MIENKEKKTKRFAWKFALIFLFINIGFIAVLSRIFIIQVIDVDYYRKKAKFQHETKVNLKSNRGDIFDRNGNIIATTIQSISIAIDPTIITEIQDRIDIVNAVSLVANIDKFTLLDKINKSNSSFVWLARGISPDKVSLLDSIKDRGFIKIFEPKRHYLFGNTGFQVIGTTDIDNKGNNGLELAFDSILQGKSGFMIMNRDASGRLRPSLNLPKSTANDGKNITLTLDINLQNICEFELKQGCQKVSAESGTVIAMYPKTGEILAFANYSPLQNDSNFYQSLRIRGITDIYEPGSTFKLITAATAIEENLIKEDDRVDGGNGELKMADFVIKDDHPVGNVTFREAMAKSSNIVFAKLASNIPENTFYKYIRDFGFGLPLGIDLPGEASGKILKPEGLNQTMKMFVGHGYGISVTPLQILSSFACVANEGVLMKPYLVKSSFNKFKNKNIEFKPEKIRTVISKETSEILKKMLLEVVNNGTGQFAKIDGLNICGKTGTAQQLVNGSYQEKSYTASFAGFFPAENPKIAMIVILNKPKGDYYGGSTAAPVFKNIANSWVSTKSNINISKPHNNDSTNVFIPNLKGFTFYQANEFLKNQRIRTNQNININEIVINQTPVINNYLKMNEELILNTKNYDKNEKAKILDFDFKGLCLRKALNILNSNGYKYKITGNGKIINYNWQIIGKDYFCFIYCN